jgi:hypothetical protein
MLVRFRTEASMPNPEPVEPCVVVRYLPVRPPFGIGLLVSQGDHVMRKFALAAAAGLALSLAGTAYAAEETKGSGVEPGTSTENKGALTAPEKDTMGTPKPTGGMTDESAASVPGSSAEGDPKNANQGALSAPEKDTMGNNPSSGASMTEKPAPNVPGADADQDSSTSNQGSLSAPEKDKSKM